MGNLTHTVGGSSNLVSFRSAARVPIDSLKVYFNPVQAGSGDPSPSNVRAISGWTNAKVTKTGKNLLDSSNYLYQFGVVYFGGSHRETNGDIILKPGTYTFSTNATNINTISVFKKGGGFISIVQDKVVSFTLAEETEIAIMLLSFTDEAEFLSHHYQLEVDSTATDYVPYEGSKIPITFPVLGKNKFNINVPDGTEGSYFEVNKKWLGPFYLSVRDRWANGYPTYVTGYQISNDSMSIDVQGQASAYGLLYFVDAIPNTTYTISAISNQDTKISVFEWDKDYNFLQQTSAVVSSSNINLTFTTTSTTRYMHLNFHPNNARNTTITFSNIQLEIGSTATTYEPYNSNNTVYGGYVDLARGVVVAEYKKRIATSFTGTFGATSNGYSVYISVSDGKRTLTSIRHCNMFKYSSNGSSTMPLYSYQGSSGADTTWTFILPSTVTSLTEANEWLAAQDEDLEFTYHLATPIEYPITPTSLKTLLDQNHVWSNTNGNTEVTYKLHDSLMIREAKKRVVSNWPDLLTVEDDKTIEFGSSISAPMNDCKLYFEPIQDTYGPPAGKNWYDKSREIENYYIAQNGNRSSDNTCAISALIPVKPGQTFTFSAFVPSGNAAGNKRFHGYSIDSKWKQQIDYINAPADATYTKTFTIPNDVYFLAVSHHKNETNAQLELGSSATAYEEYRPIRHIRGRSAIRYYSDSKFNLLDENKIIYKTGQLFNEAKHIPDNNNSYKYTKTYTPVRPNTKYTLSMYNGTTYNSGYIHIAYHDNQDEVPFKIEKYSVTGTYFTATFTTPSNTKFIRFSIPVNLTELMLVEGSSRITYATYPDDIYDVGFPYSKNMFNMNSVIPNSSVNNAWVYREADSFMYAVYPNTTCNINIFDGTIYSVSDGQYTLSMAEAIDRDIQIYGSTDGETFTLLDNGITAGNTSATFTVNGQSYIKLVCTINITSSTAYVTFKKLQLEEGSTATAYEPYACVYGGYFDPIQGKLVEEWGVIFSYNGETLPGEWISDRDTYAANTTPTTGTQVAYKLATPVTHDLTGIGIQVVKGGNTLWSDADSMKVKYWSKLKTSKSWSTIRKQVRDGYAPYIYPLGTEFTVEHSNITGGLVFVVVDHSVVNNENVMTLLMRDVYQDEVYYDYREALFYAVQEIPAGSYYFTALEKPVGPSENGTSFYFTLPSAIPAGGQFYANISYSGSLLENRTAYIYPNASSLTESFTVVISSTEIAGATYLGSTDGVSSDTSKWLMNHIARCVYGSNNYAESDARQRINSSAAGSMWWQPHSEFDRPYNNSVALPGFLYGMDESFIAAVGTPTITCKTNNAFENSSWTKNTTYTLNDKFFLPSRDEMGCGSEGGIAEGSVWGYFNGTGQSARLKHFIGNDTVTSYMLRSPEVTSAYNARMINSAGNYANGTPCTCKNIAVACVIK